MQLLELRFRWQTCVQQNTVGAGLDTLNSIENLTGSAHADILTAGAGNNTLTGGAGNDTFNVNDTGDVVSESDGTVGGVDLVNATVT